MTGVSGMKNGELLPRHPSGKFTEAFLDGFRDDKTHMDVLLEIGLALSDEDGPGYFRRDEIAMKSGHVKVSGSIRWDVIELLVEDEWGESLTPLSEKFWTRKERDDRTRRYRKVKTTDEWRWRNAHHCLAGMGPAKTVGYCKLTHADGMFSIARMGLDRSRVVGTANHYRKRRDDAAKNDLMAASTYERLREADDGFKDRQLSIKL